MKRPALRPTEYRPSQPHIYGGITKMEIEEIDVIAQFITDQLIDTGNQTMTMMGTWCMVHGSMTPENELTITVARITHRGVADMEQPHNSPDKWQEYQQSIARYQNKRVYTG